MPRKSTTRNSLPRTALPRPRPLPSTAYPCSLAPLRTSAVGRALHRRPSDRRGVMLLIVISVLMLFMLVGITFVTITGRNRRTTKVAAQAMSDKVPETQVDMLDRAFTHLLTGPGPGDKASVLAGHGLLEDMYGHWHVTGTVRDELTSGVTGVVRIDSIDATVPLWPTGPVAPSQHSGYYNGCVITMTSGPLAGHSARVTGYAYVGATPHVEFDAIGFPAYTGSLAGSSYVVNGRPYSGTGFGYDPAATSGPKNALTLNGALPSTVGVPPDLLSRPIALLPNRRNILSQLNSADAQTFLNNIRHGGAHEDYDAADFQNMHLAWIQPGSPSLTLPSFHRPELIQWWMDNYPPGANAPYTTWQLLYTDAPDLLRMLSMRPLAADHSTAGVDFTGKLLSSYELNSLDPIHLDVDNDGDGIPDSIWVDIGLPVTRDPEGRLVKPLAAFLVLDMDGRANVNAHGSQTHVTAQSPVDTATPDPESISPSLARPAGVLLLPQGIGYGPADVNLSLALTDGTSSNQTNVFNLLSSVLGRYGANRAPGVNDVDDPLSFLKQYNLSPNVAGSWGYFQYRNPGAVGAQLSGFGTPSDYTSSMYVALDHRGTPYYFQAHKADPRDPAEPTRYRHTNNNRERVDDPYELDLSPQGTRPAAPGGIENPFTVFELERVLRRFDIDAQVLPPRLWDLLGATDKNRPHVLTTESWDLPSPSFLATPEARASLGPTALAPHLTDLLQARLQSGGFAIGNTVALNTQISVMLPRELIAGQRMNLNRYHGNGVDDNGNNVIDEPDEPFPGNDLTNREAIGIDTTGASILATSSGQARQIMARHLYILMMLLKREGYYITSEEGGTAGPESTADYIAQWAVNAVDFSDRDAIMTGFEYDRTPFDADGWNIDGDLATPDGPHRGVVWGTERPELLITEAVALHDRRTEDLTPPGGMMDPHWDQRLMPEGSLFFELYNPNTRHEAPSGEFAAGDSTVGYGVNLAAGATSPAWRVIISNHDNRDVDDDPDDPETPFNAADIDRWIYFRDPGATVTDDVPAQRFFTDLAFAPIRPGHFGVVGPGDPTGATPYVTKLGWPQGAVDGADTDLTRRIVLSPDTDPTVNQVQVLNNGSTSNPEPAVADIKPAVAVVINQPRRLSVTEPVAGYPTAGMSAVVDGKPAFPDNTSASDEPFDYDEDLGTGIDHFLLTTRSYPQFRRMHLQRLANPLLPFDPDTNPYRTVDSAPVDLNVFNGVAAAGNTAQEGTVATAPTTGDIRPATWRRGIDHSDATVTDSNNIWHQLPQFVNASDLQAALTEEAGDPHNFAFALRHSLGYMDNLPSALRMTAADVGVFAPNEYDYLGERDTRAVAPLQPWITWNNRPYVSQYELTMVPTGRSSTMFKAVEDPSTNPPIPSQFSVGDGTPTNPFDEDTAPLTEFNVKPFSHLLNFFQTGDNTSTAHGSFYRLLEYVHVPSRFVGTESWLDPNTTNGFGSAAAANMGFLPPFNALSRYREPGKLNVNTIADQSVWRALLGMDDSSTMFSNLFGTNPPTWQNIVRSRRGDAQTNAISSPTPYPTFFRYPFRTAGGADLVPIPQMLHSDGSIDATLLRRFDPSDDHAMLQNTVAADKSQGTDRNPFFRYRTINRIANSATTRSNVYAVWVTVGYFEVEQVTPDNAANRLAYPDLYKLVREAGIDSGNVRRQRGFYLYDRTIPVGAVAGEKLNSHNAVLLKRQME